MLRCDACPHKHTAEDREEKDWNTGYFVFGDIGQCISKALDRQVLPGLEMKVSLHIDVSLL